MKKILCLILTLTYCVMLPFTANAVTINNNNYELKVDKSNGNILFGDNQHQWSCFPEDADTDLIAQGAYKSQLSSALIITYMDKNNKLGLTNSANECKGNNTKIETKDSAIKIIYNFAKSGFEIPVEFKTTKDGFTASILAKDIVINGENKLIKIGLMPYFGAGGQKDNGFIFVPDGSGAILNFNNGKYYGEEYNEDVYGRDAVNSEAMKKGNIEKIKLPVFGVANGNNAFLGVVTKGDGLCSISAKTAGKITSYNNVYPIFTYMCMDSYTLSERTSGARDVTVTSPTPVNTDAFEVRYIFMQHETDIIYSDLAVRYGDYLRNDVGMAPKVENVPLVHISLYGAVKKQESILGIPISRVKPITTYKQVQEIGDALVQKGVKNLSISYYAWGKNGADGPITANIKAEKVLGGNKGLKELIKWSDDNKINLHFVTEISELNSSGNGFSPLMHSASTINSGAAVINDFSSVTGLKREEIAKSKLLKPSLFAKAFSGFHKANNKMQMKNIDPGTLSNMIYSDYGGNAMDREGAKAQISNIYEQMKEYKIATSSANFYTLKYADEVYNAPLESSNFDIMDKSIPFYEIALSGLVPLSGEYVNTGGNENYMVTKAGEYGIGLNYQLNGTHMDVYENTRLHGLYGGYYKDYIDIIANDYAKLCKITGSSYGKRIVKHIEIRENVFETQYENGATIISDYSQEG